MSDTIPIMELFGPTIQGEGLMAGTISHFLRTGGCSLRCSWCDSMFAVDPESVKANGMRWNTEQIFDNIRGLPTAPYITLTGGDPCIYEELGDVVGRLHMWEHPIKIAVETQGMIFPEWLPAVDVVTFSPKGPSSGNVVDIDYLEEWLHMNGSISLRPKICIKIVIFTFNDFKYAMDVYNQIDQIYYDAFYFTAGTPMSMGLMSNPEARCGRVINSMQNVAANLLEEAKTTQFNSKVHVGCQQHVLLWPDKDKGV